MRKQDESAERLFGEALDLPRAERRAFLDATCRGKPELRRAVEELLAENDRLSGFLSASPYGPSEGKGGTGADTVHTLAPGVRLGRYIIVEPLGSGGMGVVYRGRDEKLERVVAIKLLAPGVLSGEDARRHFRREALALAKLNHPRIAAVYDVGEQDGTDYIVMELVEGDSLATKLRSGALPVKEATAIALQVAEALVEAHERGVMHRDLKPGNVMITPKGNAKVLDFGLAKMLAPVGGDAATSIAETRGLVGTPLYMSPEQALGRSLDARTDLWSLGALYYESLAGRPPFRGESSLAVLHAITAEAVTPLVQVRPDAPALAEHIVTRALEKDPELRYQRAADVETDLKRLMRDLEPRAFPSSGAASGTVAAAGMVEPRRRMRRRTWVGVAASLVVVLAVAYLMRPTAPVPRVTGITQLTHDGLPKIFGIQFFTNSLLTDGLRVYWEEPVLGETEARLMQVSTAGGESEEVPLPLVPQQLFDIRTTSSEFLTGGPPLTESESALWIMRMPGGQPRRVGNIMAMTASWSPDGNSIFYAEPSGIWVAGRDGSDARKLVSVEGNPYWIRFSSDGKRMRFSVGNDALQTNTLWEVGTDGSHPRRLLAGWDAQSNECCGSWTADGRYFIFQSWRGGSANLWAIREARDWWRKTDPEPVQLTLGQMNSLTPLPSADGKRIFFVGETLRSELVRFDGEKRLFEPFLPGLSAEEISYSSDGSRMAYVTYPEGSLWQSKADGSDRHELTFPPIQAWLPRWSPDGTRIAFSGRDPGGMSKIYVVPAEGGDAEAVTRGEYNVSDPSWSAKGDELVFAGGTVIAGQGKPSIRILNLRSREVREVPDSGGYFSPRWSPDGRWLVAVDTNSYALKLYDFSTRAWTELTKIPSGFPNWSRDSECVFVYTGKGTGMPVYRICLRDRKAEGVLKLQDAGAPSRGFNGLWMGLTPDGSILTARDTSLHEIYALEAQLP
jgi:Tol biopolymer transport system component